MGIFLIMNGQVDPEIAGLIIKLHETIQLVQSQLEVIKGTISACETRDEFKSIECIPAVSIADVEAIRLMELNVDLVKLIHDIKERVYAKCL